MSASAFKHCNMEKSRCTVFLCEPTVLTRVCASILNHEKVGEGRSASGGSFSFFLRNNCRWVGECRLTVKKMGEAILMFNSFLYLTCHLAQVADFLHVCMSL